MSDSYLFFLCFPVGVTSHLGNLKGKTRNAVTGSHMAISNGHVDVLSPVDILSPVDEAAVLCHCLVKLGKLSSTPGVTEVTSPHVVFSLNNKSYATRDK